MALAAPDGVGGAVGAAVRAIGTCVCVCYLFVVDIGVRVVFWAEMAGLEIGRGASALQSPRPLQNEVLAPAAATVLQAEV